MNLYRMITLQGQEALVWIDRFWNDMENTPSQIHREFGHFFSVRTINPEPEKVSEGPNLVKEGGMYFWIDSDLELFIVYID